MDACVHQIDSSTWVKYEYSRVNSWRHLEHSWSIFENYYATIYRQKHSRTSRYACVWIIMEELSSNYVEFQLNVIISRRFYWPRWNHFRKTTDFPITETMMGYFEYKKSRKISTVPAPPWHNQNITERTIRA